MHLYYWNKRRLEKELKRFKEGQFLMVTKHDLIFRGKIKDCFVPDINIKRVLIHFHWLGELRFIPQEYAKPLPKWFIIKPLVGSTFLDVGFTAYYYQPDEERLKMWGGFGEICHFFKEDDYSNLVRQENELIPYCQIRQRQFWQIIAFLLLKGK